MRELGQRSKWVIPSNGSTFSLMKLVNQFKGKTKSYLLTRGRSCSL